MLRAITMELEMTYDLASMSRKELLGLQRDVERALKAAEQRDRLEAFRAAERVVAEFGFTLDEVSAAAGPRGTAKAAKPVAKYRNPANPGETWSGRGRKPGWFHEALAKGADISDLEI